MGVTMSTQHCSINIIIQQVMEETLRMYPPGAAVGKQVPSGGMTLCGHYVPSGTKIMVSVSHAWIIQLFE